MTEDVYLGQRRCWFCESKQAMYWQEEAKEIVCRKCGLWQTQKSGYQLTAHEQKWLTFIGEEYENRTGTSLIDRRDHGVRKPLVFDHPGPYKLGGGRANGKSALARQYEELWQMADQYMLDQGKLPIRGVE